VYFLNIFSNFLKSLHFRNSRTDIYYTDLITSKTLYQTGLAKQQIDHQHNFVSN
jgi:hypothetical protein